MSKRLKRELEVELPCGETLIADRRRASMWILYVYRENGVRRLETDISLSARNAEAIIAFLRELSENTPRGLRPKADG